MNGVDSRDGEFFDSPIRGRGEGWTSLDEPPRRFQAAERRDLWPDRAALFAREPFDILA
jgi:hypothetical protein